MTQQQITFGNFPMSMVASDIFNYLRDKVAIQVQDITGWKIETIDLPAGVVASLGQRQGAIRYQRIVRRFDKKRQRVEYLLYHPTGGTPSSKAKGFKTIDMMDLLTLRNEKQTGEGGTGQ